MAETVKLYDLAPSPNNMKVRIALSYKKIPFEKIPVSSNDRSEVIRISGQPLTPVLTHGTTVIFDSGAILRYLDANFRSTPSLFSTDYDTMTEIERWENLGRVELSRSVGTIFRQFFSPTKDSAAMERASKQLHDLTGGFEDRLSRASWLVGDRMTAADLSTAPMIYYGMLPTTVASESPLHKLFFDHFHLGEGRTKTREWVTRVMAFDK